MRSVLFAAVLWLTATPVLAFSGAEFLSMGREFASGYAFAVLDYRTSVRETGDLEQARQERERACFLGGGMDSGILYDAVVSYIEKNPETLVQPAVGAIIKTLIAICPSK